MPRQRSRCRRTLYSVVIKEFTRLLARVCILREVIFVGFEGGCEGSRDSVRVLFEAAFVGYKGCCKCVRAPCDCFRGLARVIKS